MGWLPSDLRRSSAKLEEFVLALSRYSGWTPGAIPFPVGDVGPRRVDPSNAYEIFGVSGWERRLVDDNSPARHFLGYLQAGYFHPYAAELGLYSAEWPGRPGAGMQDLRSGQLAIDLGHQLRDGDITIGGLIQDIETMAGDPGYYGGIPPAQTPDPTWWMWR